MTGLNPEKDKIMEAAVVITDKDLNIVAQSNDLILNVNEEEINNMNDWCKKTHGQVCSFLLLLLRLFKLPIRRCLSTNCI